MGKNSARPGRSSLCGMGVIWQFITRREVSGFRSQGTETGVAIMPLDIQEKSTTIWLWIA